MLTKRIIPCLDVDKGRVVKGVNFVQLQDAGDPAELAKLYYQEGADELVFLDITASSENRQTMIDVVKNVSKELYIPFTVGGGIRSVLDMRKILAAGADKVAINTAAVKNPQLITEGSALFGNQCIVLAVDVKKINNNWEVYINGGRTPTGMKALDWITQAVYMGAGEILLTSMNYDGTKQGFDIKLTRAVSERVPVPVIASGGAGKLQDFRDVFIKGRADGALAASLFHFGELNIKDLKKYLDKQKIPIRK
jgi:cyclase